MHSFIRRTLGCSLFLTGSAVVFAGAPAQPAGTAAVSGIVPTGFGESIDRDIERVRAATSAFKVLDKAVAAGYERHVADCVANPPQGGMGFHHQNDALMDAKIEVERPEILVYERLGGGEYRLNGVEYIVPISSWPREEAPTVMGQKLKRAPKLGIWYLHVWIWEPNPSGLFADWNPRVKC
jgi:hypothetical protein